MFVIRSGIPSSGGPEKCRARDTLHDVAAEERPPIVQALAERLAEGGRLHIKEPTKESHGMPAAEIDCLVVDAGLRKLLQERSSSLFTGPLYYAVYAR